MSHGTLLVFEVTILVLAIFLGFEVISKVPALLHTPLMSGTNAIHGIVIVGAFGAIAARRVKMTAMPQMVALFNGVGGGAAALVSWAEFHREAPLPGNLHGDISVAIILSALIGAISFAGSMVAFAKLQELIQGRPIVYPGQQVVNGLLLAATLAAGVAIVARAEQQLLIGALILRAV